MTQKLRPSTLILAPALATVLAVTGCARVAESRFNPLNWFGRSQAVSVDRATRPLVPQGQSAVYDLRQPIGQITEMAIEPTDTGAVLRATGLASGQGWHNAQLVLVSRENGILTYEFRVQEPEALGAGTQTVTVARGLEAQALAGVTGIRVLGQTNAREARR